jgi:ribosomal protein S14
MLHVSRPALSFSCQEGIDARTFEEAAREGEDLIGKVGSSLLEDCVNHEKVIKKLEESTEKALKAKERQRCKKVGLAFGIFRKFKNMNQLCSRSCLYNGRLIGILGARFFCDMAQDFGSWQQGVAEFNCLKPEYLGRLVGGTVKQL